MSAGKRQADGDLVVGGDEVLYAYFKVREGTLDQLESVLLLSPPVARIRPSYWLPFFTIEEIQQYEDLLDRVLELVVVLDDDMTRAIDALGLTPSRTHLLWELGQRGPVQQRVLADALRVTPRAVTGLVDALVADGLVTREAHPADRRATLVTLTARGESLVAQLKRDHRRLARALFAPMPSREVDAFARALAGVIDRLRTHLDSRSGRS